MQSGQVSATVEATAFQALPSVSETELGSKPSSSSICTASLFTVFFRRARAESMVSAGLRRILLTRLAWVGSTFLALLPAAWVKAVVVRSNAFISPPLRLIRSSTQPKHHRLAKITL